MMISQGCCWGQPQITHLEAVVILLTSVLMGPMIVAVSLNLSAMAAAVVSLATMLVGKGRSLLQRDRCPVCMSSDAKPHSCWTVFYRRDPQALAMLMVRHTSRSSWCCTEANWRLCEDMRRFQGPARHAGVTCTSMPQHVRCGSAAAG